MPPQADLLIVGAFGPEIAPLLPRLGGSQPLVPGVVAHATAVGVGPIAAAVGMTRAIAAFSPRAVVFVGTCGAFTGSAHRIGDVAVGRFTRFLDGAASEERAAIPELQPTLVAYDAALLRGIEPDAGTLAVGVASPPSITLDPPLASSIARASGCAVENLEAFAIAYACQAHNVSSAALLGVTNYVGPSGRAEWAANHVRMSELVSDRLFAWLSRGGEGIPRE